MSRARCFRDLTRLQLQGHFFGEEKLKAKKNRSAALCCLLEGAYSQLSQSSWNPPRLSQLQQAVKSKHSLVNIAFSSVVSVLVLLSHLFPRLNTTALLMMSSGKPRVSKALTGVSSKSPRLLCFAMSALLMLASVFVPVYAQGPVATGVTVGNYPGTGNVPPVSARSPPLFSPISPPLLRRFAALRCCTVRIIWLCAVRSATATENVHRLHFGACSGF